MESKRISKQEMIDSQFVLMKSESKEDRGRNLAKEKEELIRMVAEHILSTGDSYRKTALYFKSLGYSISHVTVRDYLEKYKELKMDQVENILKVVENNKVDLIENEKILRRVLLVADLVLDGYLLEEIAEKLEVTYWTVYRDIHNRLPKVDLDKYQKILLILSSRSNDNLGNDAGSHKKI